MSVEKKRAIKSTRYTCEATELVSFGATGDY